MKAIGLVTLVVLSLLACSQSYPPDLEEYIAEIEQQGMTEEAQSLVSRIASIQTGATIVRVTFSGAPGSFGMQQAASFCPKPGVDQKDLEQDLRRIQEKVDQAVEVLRSHVDADGSGFVSTAEAKQFYEVMLAGMRVSYLVNEKGMGLEAVAAALPMPLERLQQALEQYSTFLKAVPDLESKTFTSISFAQSQG